MTIHMRHIEKHTFYIGFCLDTLGDYRMALHEELALMKGAWPNASASTCGNMVAISYEGASSYHLAEGAAENFRKAVTRHKWWKEVQL